jgi:hypothetical protein
MKKTVLMAIATYVGIVRSPLFCGEENFFVSAIASTLKKVFGVRSPGLSLEIFSTAIARVEWEIFSTAIA